MTFDELAFIFNRAIARAFDTKKNLFMASILALCGLMVIFFRSLAYNAGEWVLLSVTFLPIFLCAGVLLSAGVLAIRVYHDEIKGKEINYGEILKRSWEIIIGASYFSVPIILCYLLLWMLMGIFLLLNKIPMMGEFIGVLLSFMPFLLNLGSLILCIFNMAILFYVTPSLALKGLHGMRLSEGLFKRLKEDLFSNLVLVLIGVVPLLLVLGLLSLAVMMTRVTVDFGDLALVAAVRWFIIMVPFVTILSPAILFFFNFAAESHVLLHKKGSKG